MSHATFQEFEAYAASIQDADLRCTIPRMEHPFWSIHQTRVDAIHVQYGSEGGGNIAEGAARRDGWVLYTQCGGRRGQVNGIRLERDAAMVIVPGGEFCLASQDPHDWTSVFLPADLLFENDQGSLAAHRRFPFCQVVHPGANTVDRLQRMVSQIIAAAASEPAVLTQPAYVGAVRESLVGIARSLLAADGTPDKKGAGRPAFNRRDLVSITTGVIEACPQMSPTVQDLVHASGVSERTLRSAFLEYFGVSPRKYLNLRRLHQARKLLRDGDPDEVTVTAVAAQLGFWDFGRFANKYRQLFGELPSESLGKN